MLWVRYDVDPGSCQLSLTQKTQENRKSEHLFEKKSPVAHVGGGQRPLHPTPCGGLISSELHQLINCQVLPDGATRVLRGLHYTVIGYTRMYSISWTLDLGEKFSID